MAGLRSLLLTFAAAAIVTVAAGCGGSSTAPTPDATGSASPAVASPTDAAPVTVVPTEAPNSPSATSESLPQEVAALLPTLLNGDFPDIKSAARLVPTTCSANPPAMGRLILCPEGTAPGTEIPIVRATGCELVYPGDFEPYFDSPQTTPRRVYAVYRAQPGTLYLDWVPLGDYGVVISVGDREAGDREIGWLFHVEDGAITGIQFGCGASPAAFLEDVPTSDIVSPPVDS